MAVKVKMRAGAAVRRTIFSPEWIRDVGEISTVIEIITKKMYVIFMSIVI